MVNISLVIFFVVFLLLFIPCNVCININIKCKELFENIIRQEKFNNNITIQILGFIPVYNKQLFSKNTKKKKSKFSKKLKEREVIFSLLNKSYFSKFVLSFGINLHDYIANAYVNASLNTLLCMYINLNQKLFNLKGLYYQTYIYDELLKVNFKTNIKIRLIDFLIILFKTNKKQKQKVQNEGKNAS